MISGRAKEIKRVFDQLLADNSDIVGYILLSDDGLVLVSTLETGNMEETMAAMAARVKASLSPYLEVIEWSQLSGMVLTGSKASDGKSVKQHIMFKDVENVGTLITLVNEGVDWIKLHSYVNFVISTIIHPDDCPLPA